MRNLGPQWEHHRLAVQGLRHTTLLAMLVIPVALVMEWSLQHLGFGDANLARAATRIGGMFALMVVAYAYVRWRGHALRHPELLGTLLMWIVGVMGGLCSVDTGGFESPYNMAVVPILVLWVLAMPGGARAALAPMLGGFACYELVLFGLGPAVGRPGYAIALTMFQVLSIFVLVIFSERVHRWRTRATIASTTDALTGLLNRGYLYQRTELLIARRRRRPTPLALILFDLDHFKRINDQHGHAAGDAVLRHVSALTLEHTRSEDLCARMGGEEFLIVLDDCDPESAMHVASRLRERVEASAVLAGSTPLQVTLSAGVAICPAEQDLDLDHLMHEADQALYRSKHAGRNQVQFATG